MISSLAVKCGVEYEEDESTLYNCMGVVPQKETRWTGKANPLFKYVSISVRIIVSSQRVISHSEASCSNLAFILERILQHSLRNLPDKTEANVFIYLLLPTYKWLHKHLGYSCYFLLIRFNQHQCHGPGNVLRNILIKFL